MIVKSTTVNHGDDWSPDPIDYDLSGAGAELKWRVNLKSRFNGDSNEIRGIYLRALRADDNEISSENYSHDVGSMPIAVLPRRRPPLMHSEEAGVLTDTGSFSVSEFMTASQLSGTPDLRRPVSTVSFMFKPTGNSFSVLSGATGATFTNSAGNWSASTNGATAYINGSAWSGTHRFPMTRFVTVKFTTPNLGEILFSGAGYLSHLLTTEQSVDVQLLTDFFYRKPISSHVVTDSAAVGQFTFDSVSANSDWSITSTA